MRYDKVARPARVTRRPPRCFDRFEWDHGFPAEVVDGREFKVMPGDSERRQMI